MKTDKLLTREEFEKVAEIWYQRISNLRDVWLSPVIKKKRKDKAFMLWHIMMGRMSIVIQTYIVMNQPLPPQKQNNDIAIVGEKSNETIST
jgi:hypothetical protein